MNTGADRKRMLIEAKQVEVPSFAPMVPTGKVTAKAPDVPSPVDILKGLERGGVIS